MEIKNNTTDLAIRLQAVIDTAIDGIVTIDHKGIIETVNQALSDIFHYSAAELIGQNISILMPEPVKSHHDANIKKYLKTKVENIIGSGRVEEGQRKDGTTFPIRLAVSEVVLKDRVIFTGIIHDLTEVTKANKQLIHANEQLEFKVMERTNELEIAVNELLLSNKNLAYREKDLEMALEKEKELSELKSRFVSMASHEFRTPLSTILSSVSIISKYIKTEDNDKRQKHIDRIKTTVTNLTGILNDFLSLSRLEENKVEVNKENVDIAELCILVSDELLGLMKKGQYMEHKIVGEVRILITDKRIFKNVMFNILFNAVKYSNEGDKIKCISRFEKKAVHIDVIDEGIGIPKKDQKYIFGRFFRASNVENIQGTGLGLNIVKRYLLLLNGYVKFKSAEDKGSMFTISLPYEI
ncbi:MAG: PAS domain-containing sensor histidine kinase [Saprospiraceae bacterium]